MKSRTSMDCDLSDFILDEKYIDKIDEKLINEMEVDDNYYQAWGTRPRIN